MGVEGQLVTSSCGYEVISGTNGTVTSTSLAIAGSHFVVGEPKVIGVDVDFVVSATSADSVAFVVRAPGQYVFSGPAVSGNPVTLNIPSNIALVQMVGYAVHDDRVMFLFTSGDNSAPLWFETSRDGTIRQPLMQVHAPLGNAHYEGTGLSSLAEYSNGFAWIEDDGVSTYAIFSDAPGSYVVQSAPVQQVSLSPLTQWPYASRSVVVFGFPSLVLSDDGTVSATVTETLPLSLDDTQWHSYATSSSLGLLAADRGGFAIIDATGNSADSTAYDAGPSLPYYVQPAPTVAVRGSQAVMFNTSGNAVATGCVQ